MLLPDRGGSRISTAPMSRTFQPAWAVHAWTRLSRGLQKDPIGQSDHDGRIEPGSHHTACCGRGSAYPDDGVVPGALCWRVSLTTAIQISRSSARSSALSACRCTLKMRLASILIEYQQQVSRRSRSRRWASCARRTLLRWPRPPNRLLAANDRGCVKTLAVDLPHDIFGLVREEGARRRGKHFPGNLSGNFPDQGVKIPWVDAAAIARPHGFAPLVERIHQRLDLQWGVGLQITGLVERAPAVVPIPSESTVRGW